MSELPQFETSRLILRGVIEADAPSWQKYFNDYEVIRHLAARVPWPYPANGVMTFLNDVVLPHQGKDKWVWGIFLKEAPHDLIGCVDLWRDGKPENRGFWLARKFWGKGIMTEAVQPIIDYAFDHLGFTKLIFANAVGNTRSRRVKEKTGARFIGVAPFKFVDPALTEHEMFELIKEDWARFKKAQKHEFLK